MKKQAIFFIMMSLMSFGVGLVGGTFLKGKSSDTPPPQPIIAPIVVSPDVKLNEKISASVGLETESARFYFRFSDFRPAYMSMTFSVSRDEMDRLCQWAGPWIHGKHFSSGYVR